MYKILYRTDKNIQCDIKHCRFSTFEFWDKKCIKFIQHRWILILSKTVLMSAIFSWKRSRLPLTIDNYVQNVNGLFLWAIIPEWPGGFIKPKAYLQFTVYPPRQLHNDLSNSNKTDSRDKSNLQKCVHSGCFILAFNEYLLISCFQLWIHIDSRGVFYISASNISDTEHKCILLY